MRTVDVLWAYLSVPIPPAAGFGIILYFFYHHRKYGFDPNIELGPIFNQCQCICERRNIPVTDRSETTNLVNKTLQPLAGQTCITSY